MTDPMASQGLWGKRRGAAGLGLWAAVGCIGALGACNGYDLGDILGGIGSGNGGGHGHAGSGGHGGGCLYEGEHYRPGDTFPSSDGCNTCSCGEDGQVACTLRACVDTCGGITGEACGDGEFCSFPPEASCGAGDQTGVCVSVPEVCTFEFDPVCGCDGDTYGNACLAAAAGVSVAASGECPVGECDSADDCPVPPCACLDEDGDGQCENDCPIATCRFGQCGVGDPNALQVGDACGGFVPPGAPECDAGLFCQHQAGALCGAADAPGECVVIPMACPDVLEPVCGCDGLTYGNACEAARALVGIFELGECR